MDINYILCSRGLVAKSHNIESLLRGGVLKGWVACLVLVLSHSAYISTLTALTCLGYSGLVASESLL